MSGMYFDKDVSIDILKPMKVGVIGYGNQGRAQALNLRDSGISVTVGLREGSSSIKDVIQDGLDWLDRLDGLEGLDWMDWID